MRRMEISMPDRIGDVAHAAGVSVETVRFYEREGLMDQPEKPFRGWRKYDDLARGQLSQIRLAQSMGLNLADAKRLKEKASGPQQPFCADVLDTVTARLEIIETEILDLLAKREGLQRWLNHCSQMRAGEQCELYAQINALLPKHRKGRA